MFHWEVAATSAATLARGRCPSVMPEGKLVLLLHGTGQQGREQGGVRCKGKGKKVPFTNTTAALHTVGAPSTERRVKQGVLCRRRACMSGIARHWPSRNRWRIYCPPEDAKNHSGRKRKRGKNSRQRGNMRDFKRQARKQRTDQDRHHRRALPLRVRRGFPRSF